MVPVICVRYEDFSICTLNYQVHYLILNLPLDTIGELSFSHPYGFLDMGRDDGTLESITQALWSLAWTSYAQWVIKVNHWIAPVFGFQLSMHIRNGKFAEFAAREIEEREKRGTNHRDMLAKLLETQATKPELDNTAIHGILNSNVFAGSDTTAIALRGVFYNILAHPGVKKRFLDELWHRRKSGQLSDPIKLHETEKWPYLQALIYEALRLHPASGMGFTRIVPVPGVEADGHFLPPGVRILHNADRCFCLLRGGVRLSLLQMDG
jgi:hypothetical protein